MRLLTLILSIYYKNFEYLYINIYNYLEKGLIKNKHVWPKYIEDIKDKRMKVQKKTDFCRKMGIYTLKPQKTEGKKKHQLSSII